MTLVFFQATSAREATSIRLALVSALLFGLLALASSPPLAAQNLPNDEKVCGELVALAERARRFPKGLLYAIARVESGRAQRQGTTSPWPWTVTAEGKGRFYADKQAAVRAVMQLQRDSVTNIDVGCMQVNLLYHGRAFRSVAEAIDPVNNVAYATEYLIVLYNRHKNWEDAVSHYHSSSASKHAYYLSRVKRAWRKAAAPRRRATPSLQAFKDRQSQPETQPTAPPLSPSQADALEQEVLLLADVLRKSQGLVAAPPSRAKGAARALSNSSPPSSAQSRNADFFMQLIEEPL